MIEIPESLKAVFTGTVEERMGEHVVQIPSNHIEHGAVTPGESYRVIITEVSSSASGDEEPSSSEDPAAAGHRRVHESTERGPPVEEGEVLDVEIETIGDQGDGIAKVDRGFVVIVPDGRPGDRVTVRIESVHENMAFAEIIEHDTGVAV